ncbi:hypothetical protein CRE_12133 [Caenorhabditis remanei]|uniref:Uncharacterized protein n=1 Tax=Caenorhabditis remanei TaxID=31234 RepID=E3MQ15_CAERE|nr:hypothetical protein CRE_12133 [Caenorhabditis remanei]
MRNLTCSTSDDISYLGNANFLISQFIDVIAVLITFLSSLSAIHAVLNKSIFTISTKILLIQILIYANIHQISYSIESVELIYKTLFMLDEPCEIMQREDHCAPYLEIMLAGTSGMIYGHTALMLERLFATFFDKKPSIGALLSVILFISSASTGRLIIWDDPLKGYVIACFVFPSKTWDRSNWYFTVCTALGLFNLVVCVAVMRYNKKWEYETRFKVRERFQKREVIDSTETICFLTLVEFIFMFIYSIGIMVLVNLWRRKAIDPAQFNFWIVWCYTIPFAACVFPLLLIYRINTTRAIRSKKITDITKAKQTQEGHINQMKNMWG